MEVGCELNIKSGVCYLASKMADAKGGNEKWKSENLDKFLPSEDDLEWLHVTEVLSAQRRQQEGLREKLVRKTKENPLVPIGVLATTLALGFGIYSMKSGNRRLSQSMMRTRVVAQGFTIAAVLVGLYIGTTKAVGTSETTKTTD